MDANQSKLGCQISLPLALALGAMFFLPWLELNCGGQEVGKASGWQLTTGGMTAAERPAGGPAGQQQEDPAKTIQARPWFALGLILPLAVLAAAAMGSSGGLAAKGAGKVLVVLAAAGAVTMILAANVDYSGDLQAKMRAEKPAAPPPAEGMDPQVAMQMQQMSQQMAGQMAEGISKAVTTKRTAVVWLSLAGYVAVGGCGVLALLSAAGGARSAPSFERRSAEADSAPPLGQTLYEPPPPAEAGRPTFGPEAVAKTPRPAESPAEAPVEV